MNSAGFTRRERERKIRKAVDRLLEAILSEDDGAVAKASLKERVSALLALSEYLDARDAKSGAQKPMRILFSREEM